MEDTINRIRKFRDERDWLQFHDPKNLAVSISIEAAELLELFQWKNAEEARSFAASHKERVSDEIADVAIYLLEEEPKLVQTLGRQGQIDLELRDDPMLRLDEFRLMSRPAGRIPARTRQSRAKERA